MLEGLGDQLFADLVNAGAVTSDSIKNAPQYPVGKDKAGRDGIDRIASMTQESFEGAGWNAGTINGTYSPGLNTRLPEFFKFKQFQGPHSFKAERSIVRFGDYSAKLHWKHENPGQWNGEPNKIDNTDKKAMFHGRNASGNSATMWFGFSAYLPRGGTVLKEGQEALIFQLHGGRDDNGEPSRVPPIALTIQKTGFKVGYSWDANKRSTSTRGQGQETFDIPVDMGEYKDRWVDFVIQVRSNPFDKKGFVKMWFDGKQMVNRTNIQIGYNDKNGLYPSFGWYIFQDRPVRDNDAIIYIDEIRQAEGENVGYFDVAPGFFTKSEKRELMSHSPKTVFYCPSPALNPAAQEFGYQYAADGRGVITITQPTDIAYGADGKFFYLYNQTSNVICQNTTFGGDPIEGTVKKCYTRPAATDGPKGYNFAAQEGDRFTMQGTVNIAYGADGEYKYMYNVYNNDFCGAQTLECNSATFGGDPISGMKKHCYYHIVEPHCGPSGFAYGNQEKATLQLNNVVDVAYGAEKRFEYLENQSGEVGCNNQTFGGDPASGAQKHCYIKSKEFAPLD